MFVACKDNTDGAPRNPLIFLLELAQRARAAASGNELAFLAVNETRALAPYRQAALWFHGAGVHTLSGVVAVESNAPYAQWLDQLCRTLAAQHDADKREKIAQKEALEVELMSGPSAPSVALNQDSVDDLLADLGF